MSSSVKINGLNTNWRPLEKNEILCKRIKLKKLILHIIPLDEGGSIYSSYTGSS